MAVLKPEDLGLVTNTIVGPARRVALINGRTYREVRRFDVAETGEIITLLAEASLACHPGTQRLPF